MDNYLGNTEYFKLKTLLLGQRIILRSLFQGLSKTLFVINIIVEGIRL